MLREDAAHGGGSFEVELGIRTERVGGPRGAQRRAVAHARKHVGNSRVLLDRVDDAVGRNERHAAFAREAHEPQVALRLRRREMLLELDIEAVAEDRLICERAFAIEAPERTAGERDQAVAALSEVLPL